MRDCVFSIDETVRAEARGLIERVRPKSAPYGQQGRLVSSSCASAMSKRSLKSHNTCSWTRGQRRERGHRARRRGHGNVARTSYIPPAK